MRVTVFISSFIIACTMPSAWGKWAHPDDPVPLDRLLKNVGAFVEKNPKSAEGHYTFGRLHSLAFAKGMHRVEGMYETKTGKIEKSQELPDFGHATVYYKCDTKPDVQATEHLHKSLLHYWKATQLAKSEPLYWLGLAWVAEQARACKIAVGAAPAFDPKKPMSQTELFAFIVEAYRTAYKQALPNDRNQKNFGPGVHDSISIEAGEAITRLLQGRKPNDSEQTEIKQIIAAIAPIKKKPRAITPLVFPMNGPGRLCDFLAPGKTVSFDLAGDGVARRWPWVGPDAGFLVWDPARTGRITSGRQLFGSATWWMFWPNGYEPLAALDDNKDGWLTGKELDGIAVWRDRNGNGVCDAGEVRPLKALGITAIATTPTSVESGAPCNLRGLLRSDGSYLPTYDWTPVSVPASDALLRQPKRHSRTIRNTEWR